MNTYQDISPSPLAGRWYPANPSRLAESVDSYIEAARLPEIKGRVLGLVSPHAGHIYSGPVAGYSFAAIRGLHPELVIILSPFHQYHPGALLTSGHDAYQTPLGTVPVDQEAQDLVDRSLQEKAGVSLDYIRRDGEHAVEILLPFFQRVLPEGFRLLPLMLRRQDPDLMEMLAAILAELIGSGQNLLAASSDLSHFHPAEIARKLDQTIIDGIIALDPEELYQAEERGTGSACGLGALATVIWAAKKTGPAQAYYLNYAHSGDVTGDNSSVVGYASALITRA
jgi:AmmeMemoRadiSam system protein B